MSLPMSKLVCGIGDAPVTGAWTPMTISSSLTPAASFLPATNGPTGAAVVVTASVVLAASAVVAPATVVGPAVAALGPVVAGATVVAGAGEAVVGSWPSPPPATPDFCPHPAASARAITRGI